MLHKTLPSSREKLFLSHKIAGNAIHLLAYSSQHYPGCKSFVAEFTQHWSLVNEWIKPARFSRIGVRFVNRFDADLKTRLNTSNPPAFLVPLLQSDCVSRRSSTKYSLGSESLVVSVEQKEDTDILVVDYDGFVVDQSAANLAASLDSLHDLIELKFTRSIDANCAQRLSTLKLGE